MQQFLENTGEQKSSIDLGLAIQYLILAEHLHYQKAKRALRLLFLVALIFHQDISMPMKQLLMKNQLI